MRKRKVVVKGRSADWKMRRKRKRKNGRNNNILWSFVSLLASVCTVRIWAKREEGRKKRKVVVKGRSADWKMRRRKRKRKTVRNNNILWSFVSLLASICAVRMWAKRRNEGTKEGRVGGGEKQ